MRPVVWSVAVLLVAAPLEAQVGRGGDPRSQLQLEAATLESRGDLDGAEASLRRLLELEPTASGTIFALERVLTAKNERAELRPLVQAFLAQSPNAEVMALNLRLLIEADSVNAMVAESERWLASNRSEAAYREVARAYARGLGNQRALDLLRRGRSTLGARDALALEIGDLLAASGDRDGAVAEWALAVEDGARVDSVMARVAGLGDDADDAAGDIVSSLADAEGFERRDAALVVAMRFGLEEEALDLARDAADDLEGRDRIAYLENLATRARTAQMAPVAAWAYQELGGGSANPEDRRQVDRRIVEAALEAGDTALALDAQRRVVASYARESDDGRRAQAEAIRLEASASPTTVMRSWVEFQAAFPTAPEQDEVAAAVSQSLQARGDLDRAEAVLAGVEGPRSTLERAYLLLGRGAVEEGRQALTSAVTGLPPLEATPLIQLSVLLGRLSEAGTRALVTASVAEHRGEGGSAAVILATGAAALPQGDRPSILAEAARMADRAGAPASAATIRESLVADHPNAPETAEASLALARYVASSEGDTEAAIALLEDLITRVPNAAIVPEARVELERLRNRS